MIQLSNLSMHATGAGKPVRILNGIDLSVPKGSLFTLLGPSGCGKTTTLRSIAGLERPSSGEIWLGGQPIFSHERKIHVPTEKRNVGMVFQSYAIWPHMTVLQNVMYPLDAMRLPAADKRRRSLEALERVGLAQLAERSSTQLSGGQQQRVALARALVARPQVLLFDEPLSNLDAKLRGQMRSEIAALQKEFGITSLYVTHDQQEALSMSDQIAIMKDGEVLETGDPATLYAAPMSRFTASFLGDANYLDGRVGEAVGAAVRVDTALGSLVCTNPHRLEAGRRCHVMFRPESVRLDASAAPADANRLDMRVSSQVFLGDALDLILSRGEHHVRAKALAVHRGATGREISVQINAAACIVLPFEGAEAEAGAAPSPGQGAGH